MTTSKEIIENIENSKSDFPKIILIMEALIEVEKNGISQEFRLREFNNNTQKIQIKIMKEVFGNPEHDQKKQEELDNLSRNLKIADLTEDEYNSLSDLASEVIEHFEK
ncbi:TPA: hypothetical protein TVN92_001202 [Streptococcus equi subsp. zooepidemicus]|nr:hypothetical protein [Streptococcus equi subsp. zooepidemicus]